MAPPNDEPQHDECVARKVSQRHDKEHTPWQRSRGDAAHERDLDGNRDEKKDHNQDRERSRDKPLRRYLGIWRKPRPCLSSTSRRPGLDGQEATTATEHLDSDENAPGHRYTEARGDGVAKQRSLEGWLPGCSKQRLLDDAFNQNDRNSKPQECGKEEHDHRQPCVSDRQGRCHVVFCRLTVRRSAARTARGKVANLAEWRRGSRPVHRTLRLSESMGTPPRRWCNEHRGDVDERVELSREEPPHAPYRTFIGHVPATIAGDVSAYKLNLLCRELSTAGAAAEWEIANRTGAITTTLIAICERAQARGITELRVVVEPTGIYHKLLLRIAAALGFQTALVDAGHVKKMRSVLFGDDGKTDVRDPYAIEAVASQGRLIADRRMPRSTHCCTSGERSITTPRSR